jgi:hypothetical protein
MPGSGPAAAAGGRLIFLGNSTVLMLCVADEDDGPATRAHVRPQRGMHRFEWPTRPASSFT